ncbi:type 1 glutamine amidotransferase domain-containing protein [Kitasatospora sp. NPDC089913]|uniref:type 1 glutamine amidotransferase domain-containing protein n=1 Tax=Streptomycetaceae TaxID=2062 RepID=UPI00087CCCD7|nr:type 1 glutamine amidotransferase domain-containing protein [Streptomyces sp. TLI_053]SDT82842.1 protease I [Streptomyces sp. TLI_053]
MTHQTKALAIVTNYGVEQDELLVPVRHLRDDGVHVDIAAAEAEVVHTLVRDRKPGETVAPTHTLGEVDPADYDLLLIPGGTVNADSLRLRGEAVELVRAFSATGRPIAAICHGPWLLVEAGVVGGKRLTSYPSLRTDLANAGAEWADAPLVEDDTGGWHLVTSRNPDDLGPFTQGIDSALRRAAAA